MSKYGKQKKKQNNATRYIFTFLFKNSIDKYQPESTSSDRWSENLLTKKKALRIIMMVRLFQDRLTSVFDLSIGGSCLRMVTICSLPLYAQKSRTKAKTKMQ